MFALRQLQERYREGQQDLHCVFIYLEKAYDGVPGEELYWCMRDKGCQRIHQTGEGHAPSMRNRSDVCNRNKRSVCSGRWPPPRTRFQVFPIWHNDGFTDGKHKKRSTLADDVHG